MMNFISRYKQLKAKHKKGLTMIELMGVLLIIGILYVALRPAINAVIDYSRTMVVKNDFNDYQLGTEVYLRESNGHSISLANFNQYIDTDLEFDAATQSVTGNADATLGTDDDIYTSSTTIEMDAWKNPYEAVVDSTNDKIVITSYGKDGVVGGDDIIIASYYKSGVVETCSSGYRGNNLELSTITLTGDCGSDQN